MNHMTTCDEDLTDERSLAIPDLYLKEGDTLRFLKDCNKENIKHIQGTLPFLMTSTPMVAVIFSACERLHQPNEVRFMAVDLCDRFMMYHFVAVNKHLEENILNRSSRRREWRLLKTRIRKQALLRVLSCVQIASKIALSATRLSARKVQRYLAVSGHCYSLKSIVQSEQRVFRTVNYEIPLRSPLTFVEVLLGCLRKKLAKELKDDDSESTAPATLHSVCVAVLDVTCLQRQELFHRFFWMATSRWERTPEERIKFLEIESDYIFLAAAVITCALQLWKNSSFLITVARDQLCQLTNIPVKEMTGFATLITQTILGSRAFDVTA